MKSMLHIKQIQFNMNPHNRYYTSYLHPVRTGRKSADRQFTKTEKRAINKSSHVNAKELQIGEQYSYRLDDKHKKMISK